MPHLIFMTTLGTTSLIIPFTDGTHEARGTPEVKLFGAGLVKISETETAKYHNQGWSL